MTGFSKETECFNPKLSEVPTRAVSISILSKQTFVTPKFLYGPFLFELSESKDNPLLLYSKSCSVDRGRFKSGSNEVFGVANLFT